MFLLNINDTIFYSNKEYTGGLMYDADFKRDSSPTDIFCQLSNIGTDAPVLIERFVALLKENDFARAFELPNKGLLNNISNAILFSSLCTYGMMTGAMLESYFMKRLNDANMQEPEHSIDGFVGFLEQVQANLVDSINAVISLVNQFFAKSPDVEIYTQQKIGFKFIPFDTGLLSLFEIDGDDFISFLIYIYMGHLASGKTISRCKNCDRVFVPTVRKDVGEVYCTHVNPNGRTCKEMGYENTMGEIDKAYRKAYKTKNAYMLRMKKYYPHRYTKTLALYENWKITAKEMKQRVQKREIAETEYFRFLDKKLDE